MDPDRLHSLNELLCQAQAPVRILQHLAWPATTRSEFLARDAQVLPAVEYPPFDPSPSLDALARLRGQLGTPDEPIACWLERQADAIEHGARLLAGVGTAALVEHSRALFGGPDDPATDGGITPLECARKLNTRLGSLTGTDLGAPPPTCHLAQDLASAMRQAVEGLFASAAPAVTVVDELSANALASPETIRIRHGACFSDRDLGQLVQHEAFVHVLTSLNGRAQPDLPILGVSHPGTTRTQEGLAVFAEFISGELDVDRLQRLTNRVLAIDMALDGADFIEVYRWFRERTDTPEQSFENTRRVFRGGRVDGGVAMTKDNVYLDGLLRVHGFVRGLIELGRFDLLPLLFTGKLDLQDIPALAELHRRGLCRAPAFLPPWAADRRRLAGHLVYTGCLDEFTPERSPAESAALADAPLVHMEEPRDQAAARVPPLRGRLA